jgi:protein FRG1
MADAYSMSKSGGLKLKLKGESSSSKSSKKSKKRKSDGSGGGNDSAKHAEQQDELSHAGGWLVDSFAQISGPVFIEFQEFMYMHGLENGVFVMGAPHDPGEQPAQEELLTAVRVSDTHVAFKSAHGKYLSVNAHGLVVARSDAISPKEYFEVVIDYDYEGRKLYLKAYNDLYVGVNSEGDVVAQSELKEEAELRIRSLSKRQAKDFNKQLPEEEQVDDLVNVELNYVKKFQKFQDKKIRLNQGDAEELRTAKDTGVLHEKLLDRREKMKADRYCK